MASRQLEEGRGSRGDVGAAPRPVGFSDRLVLERAGRISVVAGAAAFAIGVLAPAGWVGASALPLLIGLLLGLPHGAVDHLVPAWLSLRARSLRARGLLLLAYVAAAGLGLGMFLLAPLPALVGFLLLTVAHFGAGEEAFNAERAGRAIRLRPLGVLAFGAPSVVLPLALWAGEVDPLLEAVAPGAVTLLSPQVRGLALGALLLAAVVTVVADLRQGRRREVSELALLLVLFTTAPPLLAFGVYFGAWHSLRHIARLLRADPSNAGDLATGRLGPPVRRFALSAALPTGGALVILVVLLAQPGAGVALLPATVAVLAGLTIPHAVVVRWVDLHGTSP